MATEIASSALTTAIVHPAVMAVNALTVTKVCVEGQLEHTLTLLHLRTTALMEVDGATLEKLQTPLDAEFAESVLRMTIVKMGTYVTPLEQQQQAFASRPVPLIPTPVLILMVRAWTVLVTLILASARKILNRSK